jgi:hypothetical protein
MTTDEREPNARNSGPLSSHFDEGAFTQEIDAAVREIKAASAEFSEPGQ